MIPSIVLLGNLLVDDVVCADGQTRMGQAGGALLYAALGAALWGQRPGLVSVLGDDYPRDVLDRMQQRGVDLRGVRKLDGPGVRTWLLYEGAVRRLIHRLNCPTHEEVSPRVTDLPREWRVAPAFHLAPMPFEVQRTLLEDLRTGSDAFISVDPHLPVTEETLPQWRDALADADAFFPGEDELLIEGVSADPARVLPRLVTSRSRLRFIAFKRGANGGVLYDAHQDRYHQWQPRTAGVVDQTGAGDAFGAGFVTAHLERLRVETCLQRAIVTASYAIAGSGPEALLTSGPADAEPRLRHWYGAVTGGTQS